MNFSVEAKVYFILQCSKKKKHHKKTKRPTKKALGLTSCVCLFLSDLHVLEDKREITDFINYFSLLIKFHLKMFRIT